MAEGLNPICKVDENGTKFLSINNNIHRTDGSKEWFLYGKRIICSDNEEFIRIVRMIYIL